MNSRFILAVGIFLAIDFAVPAARADGQKTARPGTLNYVEGQATIGTQSLSAASVGTVEAGPGQSLKTEVGKAEILLTPGVFLRLDDTSSAKMISTTLLDTEIEIDEGEATVEVAEIHKENNLRIVEDGKATDLIKTGLYEFDADLHRIRVFDGEAIVEDGPRRIKVKGGREVDPSGGEEFKARKFDKKASEQEDLYRWTSLRSSYLAEANADAARTYEGGGFGWFGDGWYWDPWFDSFTFIPGDGIFYSPFGWGFYSPGWAYAAPFLYGGGYGRRFGPNYHPWGPGAHYGSPANYGRGVRYGARSGFGSARVGAAMGGMRGGGFHGGFHGAGGLRGGGMRH
jgi:hypothetical protein